MCFIISQNLCVDGDIKFNILGQLEKEAVKMFRLFQFYLYFLSPLALVKFITLFTILPGRENGMILLTVLPVLNNHLYKAPLEEF